MNIEFMLPMVGDMKDTPYPTPEEYDYWLSRKNRTFYIDYVIGQEISEGCCDQSLIELGKTIIQMNIEEKDIPKEQLEPIYLFIHTVGGSLDQTYAFCDICIASRIPIVTVGMGLAMSAGFLILLAGHRRYALKHCNLLVHSGSVAFQGTAEQVEEAQKNYKKQLNDMRSYILSRTEIIDKVFNRNKSKDWYLKDEEIINYKVIDKFIDSIEDIF